jgi:hypothetical protein
MVEGVVFSLLYGVSSTRTLVDAKNVPGIVSFHCMGLETRERYEG